MSLTSLPKLELPKGKFSFSFKEILRFLIHRLTRFIYKPTYIGFENIPKTGPALLICNHVSYLDGPIIDAGCNRNVRYLIDNSLFHLPVVHQILSLAKAIPITYNRKGVEAAFDEISVGLRNGDLVCIFPEGYLTFTGSLGRFRPGIEWISKRDPDVPIIPMALSGMWGSALSRKYMKSHFRWWPRSWGRRVTVICGPAIPSDKVTVNYLQEVVLRLKYSIASHQDVQ